MPVLSFVVVSKGSVQLSRSEKLQTMWHVYILQCSDGSYYIGHTDNLAVRIARHNSARAAKWTACRLPVKLAYSEPYETEGQAVARERQIKRWSSAKKEALIAGDTKALRVLAKRR